MEKLPKIDKVKQVGQNLNVVIAGETITVKGTKEELAPVKAAIEKYNTKSNNTNYLALLKLLKPAETKKVVEKQAKTEEVKAEIKAVKKGVKTTDSKVAKAVKSKTAKTPEKAGLEEKKQDKGEKKYTLEEAKALLNVKDKPVQTKSSYRRGGEY